MLRLAAGMALLSAGVASRLSLDGTWELQKAASASSSASPSPKLAAAVPGTVQGELTDRGFRGLT
jgi:hypothetical protein